MSIAAAVLQIEVAFLLILGLVLVGAGLVLAIVFVSALRRNRPGGDREEEERRER